VVGAIAYEALFLVRKAHELHPTSTGNPGA
jgi:hypothetical protein